MAPIYGYYLTSQPRYLMSCQINFRWRAEALLQVLSLRVRRKAFIQLDVFMVSNIDWFLTSQWSDSLDADCGYKPAIFQMAFSSPFTICVLPFSKSPSLQETTTYDIATHMLKVASYPNCNLVGNSTNINKLAAVTFCRVWAVLMPGACLPTCNCYIKTNPPPHTHYFAGTSRCILGFALPKQLRLVPPVHSTELTQLRRLVWLWESDISDSSGKRLKKKDTGYSC